MVTDVVNMKTISINKGIKDLLMEEYGDFGTMDQILTKLMENQEPGEPVQIDNKKVNMGISEETFDKLNSLKLYSTETYSAVVFRLISENGKE